MWVETGHLSLPQAARRQSHNSRTAAAATPPSVYQATVMIGVRGQREAGAAGVGEVDFDRLVLQADAHEAVDQRGIVDD